MTIVSVLFCTLISSAQDVNIIYSSGIDVYIADYASELISKNISAKTGYSYEFTLTQNGDAFSVSYVVNPNDITGKESTDNFWEDIEKTIERALDAIDTQIKDIEKEQKGRSRERGNTSTRGSRYRD